MSQSASMGSTASTGATAANTASSVADVASTAGTATDALNAGSNVADLSSIGQAPSSVTGVDIANQSTAPGPDFAANQSMDPYNAQLDSTSPTFETNQTLDPDAFSNDVKPGEGPSLLDNAINKYEKFGEGQKMTFKEFKDNFWNDPFTMKNAGYIYDKGTTLASMGGGASKPVSAPALNVTNVTNMGNDPYAQLYKKYGKRG